MKRVKKGAGIIEVETTKAKSESSKQATKRKSGFHSLKISRQKEMAIFSVGWRFLMHCIVVYCCMVCLDDFVLPNVKWSSTFFPPDSA